MKYCFLFLVLLGCQLNLPTGPAPVPTTSSEPPSPTVVPTSPLPEPTIDWCAKAEDHIQNMCDNAKGTYCCLIVAPTQKGKSFTQFCHEKEAQGLNLNPQCIANVKTCEAVDTCTNSK